MWTKESAIVIFDSESVYFKSDTEIFETMETVKVLYKGDITPFKLKYATEEGKKTVLTGNHIEKKLSCLLSIRRSTISSAREVIYTVVRTFQHP